MILKNFKNIFFLTPLLFLLLFFNGFSQTDTAIIKADTLTDSNKFSSKLERLKQIGESSIKKVITENTEKQIHTRQLILLDNVEKEYNKVNELFKRGIDTASINREIKQIEDQFKIANEGTFPGESDIQTIRNLNTSTLLINEIITRLNKNLKKTESYLADFTPLRDAIDSLHSDTIIFIFPSDSGLFTSYFQKLLNVEIKGRTIDSNLTAAIKNLREEESYMTNLLGSFYTRLELIDEYKRSSINNVFQRETNDIYDSEINKESFSAKVNFSFNKAKLVLSYYLKNNSGKVLFLIFMFLMLVYFILSIKKKYYPDNISVLTEKVKLVFDHPIISSAYCTLMVLQFIFPHPPVVLYGLIWIISAVFFTAILWKFFSVSKRVYWLYFLILFVTTLLLDLMLKESLSERWLIFFISISGLFVAISVYKKNILKDYNKNFKIILLVLTLFILSASVLTIIFGRYNLSKVFITTWVFASLTGFLLYWTKNLLVELLNVAVETYKSDGNENFQIKLQKYKNRIPVYLKFFLTAGWVLLVLRNLYFYDVLEDEFLSFINEKTTIGDFSFSIENIMLFTAIIFISAIISKAISFYGNMKDNSGKTNYRDSEKTGGLSNWMLLIRIGVITIGILLAFAASGMPLDKMTIIIGSLGVGIGLGLQSIVNNLVSGVMLAFEKPFKIGDFIEVGGEAGKIKEIGIRSSKLSTAEGADIIIPNGDLLSKHVINWTLRNSQKRSELILKINYGDKLNEIRTVFQNIMDSNENIEKHPKPEVLMHQFSGSSAEYRLLYWTYIDMEENVKSELIVAIEDELKKAGVELTPQKN